MSAHGRASATSRWRRLLLPGQGDRSWGWRLAAPVAFGCAGLLAVTSAVNARGTDLRGGRDESLIEIVSSERATAESLQRQSESLRNEVDALSRRINAAQHGSLQRRLNRLGAPAGMVALHGPGIAVTLNDAPRGEDVPAGTDPNLLLVHQQDIQAVVNALLEGGAEAVSLEGHRIIATTGIKCVGNTVILQGIPYAPPYRIVAVGDPTSMYRALLASPEVRTYREYVPAPYHLGWRLRRSAALSVPAYNGPVTLEYAQPAGS